MARIVLPNPTPVSVHSYALDHSLAKADYASTQPVKPQDGSSKLNPGKIIDSHDGSVRRQWSGAAVNRQCRDLAFREYIDC